MKQFKTEVIRTDRFVIEIDPAVWDKNALDDYSKYFSPVETIDDIARNLSLNLTAGGINRYVEGFGFVATYDNHGDQFITYDGAEKVETFTKGIKVTVMSFDTDYEVEITK